MIDRPGLGLVRRIAAALFTHWAWRCGTTPERAKAAFLAGTGAAFGASLLLGLWLWSGQRFQDWSVGVGIIPVVVAQATMMVTALLAALTQAAGGQATAMQRTLQPLPIPTRLLSAALHVPVLVVGVVLLLVLLPAGTVVLAGMTGYGFAHGIAVLVHAVFTGLLAGVLLVGMLRALTWGSARLSGYLPTFVLVAWIAFAAVSGWRFREVVLSGAGAEGLFREGLLLWPVNAAFVLAPSVRYAVVGVAITLVLAGLVWWLMGSVRSMGSTAGTRIPIHLRFRAELSTPLFRLELSRLVRHRHTASWAMSALVILCGGAVFVATRPPSEQAALVDNLLLVGCLLAGHLPLLARGLSRRHRPYVAVLGFSVRTWIYSMMAASGLLAAMATLPFFLALAAIVGDPLVFVGGAGLLVFVIVVASVVGTVLTPSAENAGGELAGALTVFITTGASGYAIYSLFGFSSVAPVAVLMGLVGIGGIWVPAWLEQQRWQRDTGSLVKT